jgi:hypothetical protein
MQYLEKVDPPRRRLGLRLGSNVLSQPSPHADLGLRPRPTFSSNYYMNRPPLMESSAPVM